MKEIKKQELQITINIELWWTSHHDSTSVSSGSYQTKNEGIENIKHQAVTKGLKGKEKRMGKDKRQEMKNYNSKREDLEEEDQGEDERNVIL